MERRDHTGAHVVITIVVFLTALALLCVSLSTWQKRPSLPAERPSEIMSTLGSFDSEVRAVYDAVEAEELSRARIENASATDE